MNEWGTQLNGDPLTWLLNSDIPGLRYLVFRELFDFSEEDSDFAKEIKAAHTTGPIGTILNEMNPDGYWLKPGPGYGPKYRSTVWSIVNLAQLGASIHADARIAKACSYIMENGFTHDGQFTSTGKSSGTYDCHQGSMLSSLIDMGYQDSRFEKAFDWMARTTTGEGISPAGDNNTTLHYFEGGNSGPGFFCERHHKEGWCEWGAGKVMLAFGKMPSSLQSPNTEKAISLGSRLLFHTDPVITDVSEESSGKPRSDDLWELGFPVLYRSDIVEILEALALLGFTNDSRFQSGLTKVLSLQDDQGRWPLGASYYKGKTWIDFGQKGDPNPWVTFRVLKVLKLAKK